MCQTKVRLNDVTLITKIKNVTLEIAFFLGYPWKNGVVYIKDVEEKTYRDDLSLVLETKNIREYVLGAYFSVPTGNYRELSTKELVWINEMVRFYEKKLDITFDMNTLFPK